jgi:hypothetical protein
LHPQSKETTVKIWQGFEASYSLVNHDFADQDEVLATNVFSIVHDWMKLYTSLPRLAFGRDTERKR